MSLDKFKNAIMTGDVPLVRAMAIEHPEYLTSTIYWNYGERSGFALNLAAVYDQADVIRCLVGELDVDIDRQKGIAKKWSALHHACWSNRKKAAKALIEMGANPSLKDENGQTPLDVTQSSEINKVMIGAIETYAPLPEPGQAGVPDTVWQLTSPDEVVSTRLTPDRSLKLTEIFNFSARRVTSLAQQVRSKSLAQTISYFDDLSDKQVLLDAHAKLKELGGTADVNLVHRRPIEGKARLKKVEQ